MILGRSSLISRRPRADEEMVHDEATKPEAHGAVVCRSTSMAIGFRPQNKQDCFVLFVSSG